MPQAVHAPRPLPLANSTAKGSDAATTTYTHGPLKPIQNEWRAGEHQDARDVGAFGWSAAGGANMLCYRIPVLVGFGATLPLPVHSL